MGISIRIAVPQDAEALVSDIREADLAEIRASVPAFVSTVDAVRESIQLSTVAYTAEADGEILAVYGIVDHGGGTASPWMLGTIHLKRHRRALLRLPRRYVKNLMKTYSLLVNHVHSENTASIRWLQALGFQVFPEGDGARRRFRRFEMRR